MTRGKPEPSELLGLARSVALTGMLLIMGCGGSGPEPATPPPPVVQSESRRAAAVRPEDRLYQDDRVAVEHQRVVISTPSELNRWWDQVTAEARDQRPAVPAVDFSTHMVLLVAAGRSNAGDQIRVDSVGFAIQPDPSGGSNTVSFAVVTTVPDCNPFPGVSHPLEMVRMPRANPNIDWIERTVEC